MFLAFTRQHLWQRVKSMNVTGPFLSAAPNSWPHVEWMIRESSLIEPYKLASWPVDLRGLPESITQAPIGHAATSLV